MKCHDVMNLSMYIKISDVAEREFEQNNPAIYLVYWSEINRLQKETLTLCRDFLATTSSVDDVTNSFPTQCQKWKYTG